jgi:hypothetical protein
LRDIICIAKREREREKERENTHINKQTWINKSFDPPLTHGCKFVDSDGQEVCCLCGILFVKERETEIVSEREGGGEKERKKGRKPDRQKNRKTDIEKERKKDTERD